MKLTRELEKNIENLPVNIRGLAKFLLNDIEREAFSSRKIEERLRSKIRENVLKDVRNDS